MDERVKKYLMSRMQEEPQSVDKVTSDVNDRDRTLNVLQGIGGFLNAGSAARGGRQVDLSNQIDSNRGRIKQAESANQRYLAGASALDGMDAEEQRKSRFKEALGKVAPGLGSAIGDADIQDVPTLANLYKSQQPQQMSPLDKLRQQRLEQQIRIGEEGLGRNTLSATQAKKQGIAELGEMSNSQYDKAVLAGEEEGNFDPTDPWQFIDNSDWAPKWLRSDNAINARSAMDAWVENYLRDASGAAIPPKERADYYPIYFPTPGDTPESIENKRQLREQKRRNALLEAGQPETGVPQNDDDDAAALKWLETADPNDPKTQAVKKLLGK